MSDVLDLVPSITQQGIMTRICDPSTQVETGQLGECETSLSTYSTLYKKRKKEFYIQGVCSLVGGVHYPAFMNYGVSSQSARLNLSCPAQDPFQGW